VENIGLVLFLTGLSFVVPILTCRLLLRASWRAIARAYAIWFGLLLVIGVLGLGSSPTWDAAFGLPLIFGGIFFTIPVLPIIVLILRLAGIR
jgi:hypothetical protein